MKKSSLNDIALRLGVSRTLVSLVLNGKGREHRISEAVCEKVIATAKEMNYQPNQIAKGLRTGKTNTIGLIIADIANPFFGKLGREIENEASKHGYRIIFCSSDENSEKSELQIRMLLQGQVDGLIISPPWGSEFQIKALEKRKMPYVLIDRYFPGIDSDYVGVDNFRAAYQATQFMVQKGYKRIACITINNELINMQQRLEGFKQAIIDSGCEVDEQLIKILPFSHEKDDFIDAVRQLTDKNINQADSIFFTTSKAGIIGLECLYQMKFRIPDDIAVVSFDDPDAYRISNPPVTAVAQPLKEMGLRSVKILLDKMNGNGNHRAEKVILDGELIIRKSV